jgi:hypothetical protein
MNFVYPITALCLGPIALAFYRQVGMIIGYFTSWPANVWLVKRGVKVPM